MKAIGAFFAALWASLSPAKLWAGLKAVAGAIWKMLVHLCKFEPPTTGGTDDCCLHLSQVYRRPDPMIYSQGYLMAMGLSVTWDNPDIQLFEPGAGARGLGDAVSSSELQPDHHYRVQVRVWNGSYEAPAVGLPVTLSYLDFGVGATSHAVGSDAVDLGVKGSAACPAYALVDWRTPATPGHYCLQARLDWDDDANPDNNLGQENTNVVVAHSPAQSAFTLVNRASVDQRYVFEVDGYRLPVLETCRDEPRRPITRLAESTARWEAARAVQGVGSVPLSPGWSVRFQPEEPVLAGGQQQQVDVLVEPPPGTSRTPVNVNVFAVQPDGGRELAGGITLYVERAS